MIGYGNQNKDTNKKNHHSKNNAKQAVVEQDISRPNETKEMHTI